MFVFVCALAWRTVLGCMLKCVYVSVYESDGVCNVSHSLAVCAQHRADSWHSWDFQFFFIQISVETVELNNSSWCHCQQIPVTMGYSVTMDTLHWITNSSSCHDTVHTFQHCAVFSKPWRSKLVSVLTNRPFFSFTCLPLFNKVTEEADRRYGTREEGITCSKGLLMSCCGKFVMRKSCMYVLYVHQLIIS